MPKPQPDKGGWEGWEDEYDNRWFPQIDESFGIRLKDFIRQTIAIEVAREKEKIVDELAHPTKDGYCCACDYDIAVMEDKIKTGVARERERITGNIGMLRQWLNERVSHKLVSNEEIKYWLLSYPIKTLASSKASRKI